MARSSAKLTVVKGQPVYDPREPEEVLTFLFAREAELLDELAKVRAQLPTERARYAASQGLTLMLPGIPTLRGLFGPKVEKRA